MNCPNCGNPMSDETLLCSNCSGQSSIPNETPPESEPVVPVSPDVPVKKKSKKKIIIITAIVTALAIIAGILSWVFIFSKETVYVLVSEKHYTADGINYEYTTYEYDEKGNLLKTEFDEGYWSENVYLEEGFYRYVTHKSQVDGSHMKTTEYTHDEKGCPVSLTEGKNGHPISHRQYEYQYDGDLITGIDSKFEGKNHHYTLEYDGENRLTAVTDEEKEILQIEYDDSGRVTSITDMMISLPIKAIYQYSGDKIAEYRMRGYDEIGNWNDVYIYEFEYDSKDRLIRAEDVAYEYDSKGNLTSAKTDSSEFVYRYDGRKITGGTWCGSNSPKTELEYDKNGNLVKSTEEDGSYVVFEYKELRLSKEDAARFHAQQQYINQNLTGAVIANYFFVFEYKIFYQLPILYQLIDLPVDPAYGTGPMHRAD